MCVWYLLYTRTPHHHRRDDAGNTLTCETAPGFGWRCADVSANSWWIWRRFPWGIAAFVWNDSFEYIQMSLAKPWRYRRLGAFSTDFHLCVRSVDRTQLCLLLFARSLVQICEFGPKLEKWRKRYIFNDRFLIFSYFYLHSLMAQKKKKKNPNSTGMQNVVWTSYC